MLMAMMVVLVHDNNNGGDCANVNGDDANVNCDINVCGVGNYDGSS